MDSDAKNEVGSRVSVVFKQGDASNKVDVRAGSKVLVAAIKNKVDIRYGCSACRCGTCGVAVSAGFTENGDLPLEKTLSSMEQQEKSLLEKMSLPLDGTVRLACQARVVAGEVEVDLGFQGTYSPDDALDDEDDYYDDEY